MSTLSALHFSFKLPPSQSLSIIRVILHGDTNLAAVFPVISHKGQKSKLEVKDLNSNVFIYTVYGGNGHSGVYLKGAIPLCMVSYLLCFAVVTQHIITVYYCNWLHLATLFRPLTGHHQANKK